MAVKVVVSVSLFVLVSCSVLPGNGRTDYDTIVIGLGAAGTTAAATLAKAGRKVLAVEAQDRIGGRVWTVPFGDGIIELGAEWIHGINGSRVYKTAVNGNISVIFGEVKLEAYNSDGTKVDSELIKELIDFGFEVDLEAPDSGKPMLVGDFITGKLKDYLKEKHPELSKNKVFEEQIILFLNNLVSNNEASSDWNEVTTVSRFQELGGNQQTSWGRHGYKTFFELLLNKYNNGPGLDNLEIKLKTEVTNINYEDSVNGVNVTCKDGTVYHADNVIVTVSLGVLKDRYKTLFTPLLIGDKVTAIENLSMGILNKVVLKFSEVWWPKDRLFFGFLWKREDINKLNKEDRDWLPSFSYASCPEGASDALTVWFSGNPAKKMESIPDNELTAKCMQVLRMFMGRNQTIPDPVGILRSSWYSNAFTRGAYSYDNAWSATHAWGRAAVRRPVRDRVLFAGEVTDDVHFSTVHGASDSGYREAIRILEGRVEE